MIKWFGAIWCELLTEFELVLSISIEKVDGALFEGQLCSVPLIGQ